MRRGQGHDPTRVVQPVEAEAILEAVRKKRYAEVAKRAKVSLGRHAKLECCCGGENAALPAAGGAGSADGCGDPCAYAPEERASVPREAVAASAGCGNPVALARLHPGEGRARRGFRRGHRRAPIGPPRQPRWVRMGD